MPPVKLHQHVAGLHRVPAIDPHLGDAARRLRRDGHLLPLDKARSDDRAVRLSTSAAGQEYDPQQKTNHKYHRANAGLEN
jgi:hypothetical protein